MTNHLPLECLSYFKNTFTQSNLTYKLIPRLIKMGYITREKVGYNKEFGSNNEQQGKATHDTVKLTKEGLQYVTGTLGTSTEMDDIRHFYQKQQRYNDYLVEERIKRSVLTDLIFNREPELSAILKKMEGKLKRKTYESLVLDAGYRYWSRYYRGIEIKRVNGDISKIDSGEKIENTQGKFMSGSKIFGAIKIANEYIPIYHAGHYNVGVSPKNEELVINKLTSETGTKIKDAIYIYQSLDKLSKMVINQVEGTRLDKHTIYDVLGYRNIYAVPNGIESIEISSLNEDKTNGAIRERVKRNKQIEYMFTPNYVKKAKEETYGLLDSMGIEHNYYVGYVVELRRVSEVLEWYLQNPHAKPLCIICSEEQKETYRQLFRYLHENKKLFFASIPLHEVLKGVSDN